MRIDTSDNGVATAKVTLTGRLDVTGAGALASRLATLAGTKQSLIIDMSGVSFLSSTGLRQLLTTAKTLLHHNGALVLLNPIQPVAEVVAAAGLTRLLPIVHSESEAIAALRRQSSLTPGPAQTD